MTACFVSGSPRKVMGRQGNWKVEMKSPHETYIFLLYPQHQLTKTCWVTLQNNVLCLACGMGVGFAIFNVEMLKIFQRWNVEMLNVEMTFWRKMLKCWRLKFFNVEMLQNFKVEMLKRWNVECWNSSTLKCWRISRLNVEILNVETLQPWNVEAFSRWNVELQRWNIEEFQDCSVEAYKFLKSLNIRSSTSIMKWQRHVATSTTTITKNYSNSTSTQFWF